MRGDTEMIWIIGGTKDSRDIFEKLIEKTDRSILVSTATEYGGKLLEEYIEKNNNDKRELKVVSERLSEEQMKELIKKENINLIVDASHPYAINVSNFIIKVTDEMNVKYMRFERKMLDYGNENIEKFDSLEEVNEFVKRLEGKNILSTLGSNNLKDIKEMGEKNNLYVRMLPTADSIKKAEELGYLPSRIIAIQGPISKILNKAMLETYKIDYLITKESGTTGGEQEKIEACRECGTTVLVIKRPFLDYGKVYYEIDDLMKDL